MTLDIQENLTIVYTTEIGEPKQVKLPVQAGDIYVDGVIDRKKVCMLAASNEVENNRAVLDPFVIDAKGDPL